MLRLARPRAITLGGPPRLMRGQWRTTGLWYVIVALVLLFAPRAAVADEPGVTVHAIGSAEVVLAAGAETEIRPAADLEVEGPLALGGKTPARVFARLRVLALPSETVSLGAVETFRAAEVSLGAFRRIGRVAIGEQEIWTSLEAEWGFSTALPGAVPARDRHARHYGGGFRVEERKGGAWLSLLYGRHESAGVRGWGQWILSGAVPLGVAKGAVVLGGDAVLSVGPPAVAARQRDIVRLYVGVSLPDLIAAVR